MFLAVIIDWTFEIHVQILSTWGDLTCCFTCAHHLAFSSSSVFSLSVKGGKLLQGDYEIL